MPILHMRLHLKMGSPKGLSCTPQAQYGMCVGLYSGSLSFCLKQLVNCQLSSLFSVMLRHRAISGYPVWGESMLGSTGTVLWHLSILRSGVRAKGGQSSDV
jgi:hypothetical protein